MGVKDPTAEQEKNRDIELKNFFVDREDHRHTFKRHLLELKRTGINPDGIILIYSGVGGIGKTLLFKEFEKLANEQNTKFVRYDFKDSIDMLYALKTLRQKLYGEYGIEFPLFDKGCIYLAQKDGFVSSEQEKEMLKSSSMFRSFKKKFSLSNIASKVTSTMKESGDMSPENEDKAFWENLQSLTQDVAPEILEDVTIAFKFSKPVLDFIDAVIARREEEKRKDNKDYKKIADELEERNRKDHSAYVKDFLPKLFVQDLTFGLKEKNIDLIIFLDTYEILKGEEGDNKKTVRLISENRDVPIDWWVGELLAADRVMWVIAGRYKLNKIGNVNLKYAGQLENYIVDVFNRSWANKYLEKLGVEEDVIRKKIIEVTGGHPFYLSKCFITYDNKREGEEPDFGENLQQVIERAVNSFDANSLALLQKLCILGRWTDEIFRAVIPDYNPNIYKRLKSILCEESFADFGDGKKEKIYSFDRTISSFLLPSLRQDKDFSNYFTNIRDRTNAYFEKFFSKIFVSYDEAEFYFGMWSDIVLRTTGKPAELMTFYEENFVPLERHFDNSTRATVVQKFLDKVSNAEPLEPLPQAYFQDQLGRIRQEQNRIKEALELNEAAYSKVKDLPLSKSERLFKLYIMSGYGTVLKALERYTDEIKLLEEMVSECERYLPDDIDLIIALKNALADALEKGDRKNESFDVRQQILDLLEGRDDKRYINEVDNIAGTFEFLDDYKSALPFRRKIVALYEKNNDDEHLVWALGMLIYVLGKFSDKEHLEERAERYSQYIALRDKIGEEISDYELKKFAETLQELGLDDEAAHIEEKIAANSAREAEDLQRRMDDLQCRIESVEMPNVETVELMIKRLYFMRAANFDEAEKDRWEEKIKETIRAIIERTCREPVADYDASISTLNDLLDLRWGYEDIALKRNVLAFTEKKSDATTEEIIAAKKDLANGLCFKEDLTDEDKAECGRLFEEVENYYRQNLPASRENLLKTLDSHSCFIRDNLENIPAAIEKREEIITLLESDSETPAVKILSELEGIANMFDGLFTKGKNYPEEFIWRRRILEFCHKHFVEDAPETLKALEKLIYVCDKLNDYDKAECYSQELIAAQEKNLGKSHIDVIRAKERQADALHYAEKYDEEIALLKEIVELYRENFKANAANKTGWNLRRFIWALENFADRLNETVQREESVAVRKQLNDEELRYRRELVDLYRAEFPESYDTLKSMEELAEAYSRYNKEDEALKTYRELPKFTARTVLHLFLIKSLTLGLETH